MPRFARDTTCVWLSRGAVLGCKCHVLSGEVELKPYSTFALSDAERATATRSCAGDAESDVTIELLHYDPENYRLQTAIRDVTARVSSLAELTHDIVGLTLTSMASSAGCRGSTWTSTSRGPTTPSAHSRLPACPATATWR